MDLPLWTMDQFTGRASQSAREYYPQIYGDKAEEAQKVLYEYVEEHHLTYLKPMKSAVEFLDFLIKADMPIGIVSNKRHSTLLKEVDFVNWNDKFLTKIGAGFADKDKPSPDPLELALKNISPNIKAEEILYVGDTETDLLSAQNFGCNVIFIQSDRPRPELVEKYQPLAHFNALSEFYLSIKEGMELQRKAVC